MSDQPQEQTQPDEGDGAAPLRPERTRRRPEQTSDDTDRGWGEGASEDEHDRWLREQRPPHWE